MPTGLILTLVLFIGVLLLAARQGNRKRNAALRHELELMELKEELNKLASLNNPDLGPVMAFANKTIPLAELSEGHGRYEFFWHHRAVLRLCVVWARAIIKDPACADPRYNHQVLFALTFINKRQLDAALEVLTELWLMDDAPRPLKVTCLNARIEMYKIGGFYDEAARTERDLKKLAEAGDDVNVRFEIS